MIDSYKSLLPDSAGNAVVLLAQISKQLDGLSNGTHVPITVPSASISPKSSTQQSLPPTSAVWVNSLWFLSLVISLFCALLATLQQRWARRYLQLTQPQVAIHKRAHIRSYFAEGLTRFRVSVTVEAIPTLLHISVFLFLSGLVISLFAIHHTVAYVIFSAVVVCFLLYAAITVMPVISHDSPYTSPFSAPAWYISRKITLAVFDTVNHVTDFLRKFRFPVKRRRGMTMPSLYKEDLLHADLSYRKLLSLDMTEAAHVAAARANSQLDARALGWTLDQLDEEGELVKFAAGIPGFFCSTKVGEASSILENAPTFSTLHRDLCRHILFLFIFASKPVRVRLRGSKPLPESVREQRMAICLEALYYLPHAIEKILTHVKSVFNNRRIMLAFFPFLKSVRSWLIAERLSNNSGVNPAVRIGAQCMATVVASQPPPDMQVRPILMRQLGISEAHVLDRYLEPFDSLLLKNLNNFLRNTALPVIRDKQIQHHIRIVLTTVFLAKRLKFEHAAQELREEFESLHTRILQLAIGSIGKAKDNAEELLDMLSSLTIEPIEPHSPLLVTSPPLPVLIQVPPSPVPSTSGITASAHSEPTNVPDTAAALTSAHPPQTSQSPSVELPFRTFSQLSDYSDILTVSSLSQQSDNATISSTSSPTSQNGAFTSIPISDSL